MSKGLSPAVELDAVGQFGELVGQSALLDDSFGTYGDLAERVCIGGGDETKLMDDVRHNVFGCGVFTDDDVAALLVGLEHADHLIWNV